MRYPWKSRKVARSSVLSSRSLLHVEELEVRNQPSVILTHAPSPHLLRNFNGYTATQVLQAYGFNQLNLTKPGLGQTIAIVDAYDTPQIQADLATFDAQYNLPAINLTVVKDGATQSDPSGGWELETALDVEWVHAIAPYANIVLVEAANDNVTSAGVPTALLHAVSVAASRASVVSLSWGVPEFRTETQYDSTFAVSGVTFVAASGDSGTPPIWPAVSPNVVGVGGTTLQVDSTGNYLSETGWGNGTRSARLGGSGGGLSVYESEPVYQLSSTYTSSVTTTQNSSSKRMSPDVAYDANPNTGVAVYDQMNGGWLIIGGTSAGAPQWAALVALADQVRAAANPAQPPLSSNQTLTALYQEQADFHDITAGNNGYAAGAGYDLVTGLGSPQANLLVPALAAQGISAGLTPAPPAPSPTPPGNSAFSSQLYVMQIYQTLLNRLPDSAGLAYWSGLLDQGTSPASVVAQIEQSLEYRTIVVQGIYQTLLHRAADPLGLSVFTGLLGSGGTVEQVQAMIAGSAEYFQSRAGGQTDAFLTALYADALNRAVDPLGQSVFGQELSQGTSRAAVAAAIFSSTEYRQDLVEGYYQTYLGRPADSGGLAYFVNALAQGATDQDVIAAILGSQEFIQKL
ncbi:MAG TPA: DUF4214 domain-containing protein [Gemmataceae bacterium]|nr:DUF4214 domain-containing protein [Gemmataceae bacterium]